jgi:hypothetical protein
MILSALMATSLSLAVSPTSSQQTDPARCRAIAGILIGSYEESIATRRPIAARLPAGSTARVNIERLLADYEIKLVRARAVAARHAAAPAVSADVENGLRNDVTLQVLYQEIERCPT